MADPVTEGAIAELQDRLTTLEGQVLTLRALLTTAVIAVVAFIVGFIFTH